MGDPVEEMLGRARQLAAQGPGRVEVAKTTDVSFVGAMREAATGLDEPSQQRIDDAVAEARVVLNGIEGVEVAAEYVRPWYRRSGILLWIDMIRAPKKTMDEMQSVRQSIQHNEMLAATGGPKPQAAPVALVKAAEAWLVAQLAAPDAADEDQRTRLSEPWLTARVNQRGSGDG